MLLQQSFKHFFAAMVFVAAFVGCVGSAEAGIQRLDTCSQTFSPAQQVPVIRERRARITVRGDFTDLASYTGNSLLSLQKVSTANGGGLNTFAVLEMTPSVSIGGGAHTITVHYPLGIDETFQINIFTARITSITINLNNTNVIQGTSVTITAQGSNLNIQGLHLNQTFASHFGPLSNITTSSTSFSFTAQVNSSVNLSSSSYGIAALSDSCAENALPGGGQLNLNVGLPDLVPVAAVAYRLGSLDGCGRQGIAPEQSDTIVQTLCNLVTAPTQTNPHVEQLVDVGGVRWGVRNNSSFAITTPFRVQLKNGINIIQEQTVQSLGANQQVLFTFNRPENRRTIVRDFNCPRCMDKNVAPFNWVDPIFTVVVDVGTAVRESSEGNNSANSN